MRMDPGGSWYLTGSYGSGKTHLLYGQYRELVLAGKIRFHVCRDLVEELRRAANSMRILFLRFLPRHPDRRRSIFSGTTLN